MKEYIIATLASLCFTNPVENNEGYSTLETQKGILKTQIDSKHRTLNEPFDFNSLPKQDKIIYDTAPTKWTKVK